MLKVADVHQYSKPGWLTLYIANMADYRGPISLSHSRDHSNTSEDEEDDHHSPRTAPPRVGTTSYDSPSMQKITTTSKICRGEVSTRKPRGRPPGSKNKPKPPVVVTRESDSAMKPTVLEISAGSDIIDMVVQLARRRHLGFTIFSGSGSVSNVTLRHPGSHAPSLTLHGPFNILSLTGTFLGYSSSSSSSLSSTCFGISLAGGQGQVFGGIIAGKVTAASTVVLVGATFMNPTFHRLPGEFEESENQAKPPPSGGGASEGGSNTEMSMSVFGVAAPQPLNSCQVSSPDHHVLPWGPTSHSQPPY
ncbi:unnamed protein product [Ilex paraguariensis]|uniref:PPC domain-containing protein n=1 Tax=Ilex paraguariensis TaxID=185542 RepID=A0ABC8UTK1_9AQUA